VGRQKKLEAGSTKWEDRRSWKQEARSGKMEDGRRETEDRSRKKLDSIFIGSIGEDGILKIQKE
jgi:hypothetical protein